MSVWERRGVGVCEFERIVGQVGQILAKVG